MAFWKKKPLDERAKAEAIEICEEYINERLIDVKSDIEGINRVLNEHNKRMDDFLISFHSIKERESDAKGVKNMMQHLLAKLGFERIKYDS